jgi:hypothetical protein
MQTIRTRPQNGVGTLANTLVEWSYILDSIGLMEDLFDMLRINTWIGVVTIWLKMYVDPSVQHYLKRLIGFIFSSVIYGFNMHLTYTTKDYIVLWRLTVMNGWCLSSRNMAAALTAPEIQPGWTT